MEKKSNEYWQKRFTALEDAQNRKGTEYYAELEKQYTRAAREVQNDIDVWYSRFATNNGISLQEARKMLSKNELEEFHWNVMQYIEKGRENAISHAWEKQLENASAKWHISRLEALKVQMQNHVELLYGNEQDSLAEFLVDVYTDNYYHTAYEIQKGFNVGYDLMRLDRNKIEKVLSKPWAADGSNFSDRIWKHKAQLVSELHNGLTQSIIRGQDSKALIEHISKRFEVSKGQAARLVMTETSFIQSASTRDSYKELGVEQYEIVATLDRKTSELCRGLDGKHFPLSQYEIGATAPPFHVWCRTTTVPYFDDEFELDAERVARGEDGSTYYIPASMKYPEWKERFVDGGAKTGLTALTVLPKSGNIEEDKPSKVRESLIANNVEYREVQPLPEELSIDEIVERLGGGDMTKGSCSSLAFAYIGNRHGYNVLDFRDGSSRSVFAMNGNIKEIANMVNGHVVKNVNDFKAVKELIAFVEEGKEYYLATGSHAAIIRKVDDTLEYLELQSAVSNGYKELNSGVLQRRFACKKTHTSLGRKYEVSNVLIDSDLLKGNEEFRKLLGYINTAEDAQKKGVRGSVK